MKDFEASRSAGGVHHRLAQMAGEWEGPFRIWFEPGGEPADESIQRGTIRAVLGGRFLLHEYIGTCCGDPVEGIALYGYHIDEQTFETAWAESFGTGTSIIFSAGSSGDAGDARDPRIAMLGSYADGHGGPRWGWRTEIDQSDADHLHIVMFNISPVGEEAKAVEILYERRGSQADRWAAT